ncbi:ABC transporter ATP-binding protein [Mesobacillus subterraneus]|uniref:Energy-coupling factor ABC transporter ATP-binding protein n=1 Tax=Mesobacillus subterraneus TaxID=285983 RepID=A0A3R9EYP5_9BACI|nr:ABC transporter ATP-binding protein [Mesobacillus subterraneus]RSD26141.1 energy-coupling factor ABC transporter ATP-binding protein [Mesobacillus subterraneus]
MKFQRNELLLQVSDLLFRFDEDQEPVLKNISFEIHENEAILVLGSSGSGKSTLAYCLNNLYPSSVDGIQSGNILFQGRDVSSFQPGELNQRIGLVMQDPDAQFCMLTVEEELAFVLENMQTPRSEMEARIHSALEYVDMIAFKHRMIHSLSGGQKQKLAIACALAMEPEVLILDEPTANLDPASGLELVRTLKELRREHSFSILIIEHNLDYWLEMVERCLILNSEGELIFDGPTRVCFTEHARLLAQEGIWLPRAVEAGLKLLEADLLNTSSLPLTIEEIIQSSCRLTDTIKFLKQDRISEKTDSPVMIYELNKISYTKNHQALLKEISLSVKAGEFLAIAGSNGSGKTTLSRCLAGLLPLSAGEIKFYGDELEQWREEEKWARLGYVFQNPEHQFVADSVLDEINYSLEASIHGTQAFEINDILKTLRMTDQLHNHPFSLSQGQKRRLSVAVMLINGQKVLIMDEPTFGQDALTAKEIMEFTVNSVPESGSIIMITHDMDLIDRYADKVMVLGEGRMLFCDSPSKLWDAPEILAESRLKLPFLREMEKMAQLCSEGLYAVK